jgi:hypothetical protein
MTTHTRWLLTLALCFTPSLALAQEWTATFTVESVSNQRLGSEKKLLLAVAGPSSPELSSAALALRGALDGLPDAFVKEVREKSFEADDDIAIAKSSKALGQADAVFVLRVFEGTPPTAVVSVMRQDGTLKRAFTAKAGMAVAGRASTAGEGASEQQLARVDEVTKEGAKTTEKADSTYKAKAIFIGTPVAMISKGQDEATFVVGQTRLYQGGEVIPDEPALYRAIGRPDLAASYESSETTKDIVKIGGLVALGVGSLIFLIGANNLSSSIEDGTTDTSMLVAGCVVGGVGLVSYLIGSGLDPSPVSDEELRGLVHGYNKKLRVEHGMDEASSLRVRLGMSASHQGVGLRLSGSF